MISLKIFFQICIVQVFPSLVFATPYYVDTGLCDSVSSDGWVSSGGTRTYCTYVANNYYLDCINPMGVNDTSVIVGDQMQASSSSGAANDQSHGRLNDPAGWEAGSVLEDEWVGVRIFNVSAESRVAMITAFAVQGKPGSTDRVMTFKLYRDYEGTSFAVYTESSATVTFNGPSSGDDTVYYELAEPFTAKYVIFIAETWSGSISMRFELYGCFEAAKANKYAIEASEVYYDWFYHSNTYKYYFELQGVATTIVGQKVYPVEWTASSDQGGLNAPEYADIRQNDGTWMASGMSDEWLQLDFGYSLFIMQLKTRGASTNVAVNTFQLRYSVDGQSWNKYLLRGSPMTFISSDKGDGAATVTNNLPRHIFARYIRFYPHTFEGSNPALRVQIGGISQSLASCDDWYSESYTTSGFYLVDDEIVYCPFGVGGQIITNYTSCEMYQTDGYTTSSLYYVDMDGIGGTDPFQVYCDFTTILNGAIITKVSHDSESTFLNPSDNSYQSAGSYPVTVSYDNGLTAVEVADLVNTRDICHQYIRYSSIQGPMWANGNQYTWWTAPDGTQMIYWGGASSAGPVGCLCGQQMTCRTQTDMCNVDYSVASLTVALTDGGFLRNKASLPVHEIYLGGIFPNGEATVTLKELVCIDYDGTPPTSCSGVSNAGYSTTGKYLIDPDGVGGDDPIVVICDFDSVVNAIVTKAGHEYEDWRTVAAYGGNGAWVEEINYDYAATLEQLGLIVSSADACRQEFQLVLYEGTTVTPGVKTWWNNRNFVERTYFGGADDGSTCVCGLYGQCYDSHDVCNSDAAQSVMMEDGGWITNRDDLPIAQLHLGDNGGIKYLEFKLGKVECFTKTSTLQENCYDHKQNGDSTDGDYLIDPDGTGGNDPFVVNCDLDYNSTHVLVTIDHDSENETSVTGHSSAGEYMKQVSYDGMNYNQLLSLFDYNYWVMSVSCTQNIKYDCYNSRLLKNGYSWWVSRTGTVIDYWGGSDQSGYCACGLTSSCTNGENCNCDAQQSSWDADEGDLEDPFSEVLPVMQLRIGDTGSAGVSEGAFTLGKLYCYIGPGEYVRWPVMAR